MSSSGDVTAELRDRAGSQFDVVVVDAIAGWVTDSGQLSKAAGAYLKKHG